MADPVELIRGPGEAAPPPDVTVPDPSTPAGPATEASVDPQLLLDVKSLADRVGGLEKLRELVDALIQIRR
jgi:hypothetical protein